MLRRQNVNCYGIKEMEKIDLMNCYKGYMDSPIGPLEIICNEKALLVVEFVETKGEETEQNEILKEVKRQLEEYFEGKRKNFELELFLEGTDFQKKVWSELANIPYGETISYKEQAERIGNVKAIRAVGTTNGKNKIPIILPCHRVIGTNGKLTGYAGGLHRKQWLLDLEKRLKIE